MNHHFNQITNRTRSIVLAVSMLLALGCGFLQNLFPGSDPGIIDPGCYAIHIKFRTGGQYSGNNEWR